MKTTTALLFVTLATLSFFAGSVLERKRHAAGIESRIIRQSDARQSTGAWGSIRVYTREGTGTQGASSMLTAELEFLPGKRLQPPHRHDEEEFQYVIAGHGTWHLEGRDIPLEPGDLMYAKPGDLHGIANTGAEPLRFLVVKWAARGAAPP